MVTEPSASQKLIAKTPSFTQLRDGYACDSCGVVVSETAQSTHKRWHFAVAQLLPVGLRPTAQTGGFNIH